MPALQQKKPLGRPRVSEETEIFVMDLLAGGCPVWWAASEGRVHRNTVRNIRKRLLAIDPELLPDNPRRRSINVNG